MCSKNVQASNDHYTTFQGGAQLVRETLRENSSEDARVVASGAQRTRMDGCNHRPASTFSSMNILHLIEKTHAYSKVKMK